MNVSRREAPPQLSRTEAEELLRSLSRTATVRRRARAWIRTSTAVVAALLMAGVLIWATTSLIGLRAHTTPGSQPQEEPPNYRFEDVEVTEYVDPRTGEVDPGKVGILGTIVWTTGVYPGVHQCTWTAFGPDGSVVGQLTGEVDSMSEGARHPTAITVSQAAASAQVTCYAKRLDTPVAYEIQNPTVASVLEPQTGELIGAKVLFEAVWPEGIELPDYPGENSCTARITRPSGELATTYHFTLSVPQGAFETPLIELKHLPGITGIQEISELAATITCEPFTGAPDQTG